MSRVVVQGLAGAGFALVAIALSWRFGIGRERELARATIRAYVQLAAVGALIALVFAVPALGIAFVALMVLTASVTAGGRLSWLPQGRLRALVAVGVPALTATARWSPSARSPSRRARRFPLRAS